VSSSQIDCKIDHNMRISASPETLQCAGLVDAVGGSQELEELTFSVISSSIMLYLRFERIVIWASTTSEKAHMTPPVRHDLRFSRQPLH
jgi:hypothetical protein